MGRPAMMGQLAARRSETAIYAFLITLLMIRLTSIWTTASARPERVQKPAWPATRTNTVDGPLGTFPLLVLFRASRSTFLGLTNPDWSDHYSLKRRQ